MSFDKVWLDPDKIDKAMGSLKVFIKQNVVSDSVSLRLRTEIVEWLKFTLVGQENNANIKIIIGESDFDSDEEYKISENAGVVTIEGNAPIAVMYGLYAVCRLRLQNKKNLNYSSKPSQSLRMINHWDQVDGTIERGYSGESIFFGKAGSNSNLDKGDFGLRDINGDIFRRDYARITWYARMLSSIGINAVSLNNVNVRGLATHLIEKPYLNGVAEIAKIFTSFGIKTYLAVNWESPKHLSDLTTSDPMDAGVIDFWKSICKSIYEEIPNFGGFVVKADSEGEPGPYAYGRNHAQGANMLADALKPYNGLVIWRAFVYNSKQDWRDRSTDRAKAAYENFMPLDGKFDDNVVLQMKFGPIDFQTEEPLMPLFGKLKHTNQIMEFEITAEYLGHQIDINYTLPQWLKMTNFDTKGDGQRVNLAKSVVKNNSINPANSGFAAVGNVGIDYNWTGNCLAQANLYAYGKLCWNENCDSEEVLHEWIDQTFYDSDDQTQEVIFKIMSTSNETYKMYNAPLGVGFMVIPHYHYGVSINGYEYDRWGTYHFADRNGVGVDRTTKTGTKYTSFYAPKVAAKYENINTVPDDIILFFHHVSYDHILQNGKTLVQTIYDLHFEGYDRVQKYVEDWKDVEGKIADRQYNNVSKRLDMQLENALEWRDQVNTYFYRMSGIKDEKGRTIYE